MSPRVTHFTSAWYRDKRAAQDRSRTTDDVVIRCLWCKEPVPDESLFTRFCSKDCRDAFDDSGHGE